jgi:hypothetical protein
VVGIELIEPVLFFGKKVLNYGLYHLAYGITVVWCQRISTEGRKEGMNVI